MCVVEEEGKRGSTENSKRYVLKKRRGEREGQNSKQCVWKRRKGRIGWSDLENLEPKQCV